MEENSYVELVVGDTRQRLQSVNTMRKRVKVLAKPQGTHWVALLISDHLMGGGGSSSHGVPVYSPCWYQIILLGDRGTRVALKCGAGEN